MRSEIECYKCNNFGHIAINYRMRIPVVRNEDMPIKVWLKHKNNYECGIDLQAQNHNSGKWYVDRGCSKNMTGSKDVFCLEKDKGYVSFGNNNSAKLLGKGTVKLGNK